MSTRLKRRLPLHGNFQVWSKLLERLEEKSGEAFTSLLGASKIIETIVEEHAWELLYRHDGIEGWMEVSDLKPDAPAVGVDSSSTKPVRIGHLYYAAVTAAAVGITDSGKSVVKPLADVVIAPDSAEPEHARLELKLRMFELEVEALKHAEYMVSEVKADVVFLDGPIVDPPGLPAVYSDPGLSKRYDEYVNARASTIARLLDNNILVIGIVKRIEGSLFRSFILKENGRVAKHVENLSLGDYGLTLTLTAVLRTRLCKYSESRNYMLVLKPFQLDAVLKEAVKYTSKGFNIVAFYVVPRLCGKLEEAKPIRVEIAYRGDMHDVIKRTVIKLAVWHMPGTNVPMPVYLAHYACSIRRREAVKMLKHAMTRIIYASAAKRGGDYAILIPQLLRAGA